MDLAQNFYKDYQQPRADPGKDDNVCGLDYELQATFSTPSDSGYWQLRDGPGTVTEWADSTADTTLVSVSDYGFYDFNWTEVNRDYTDDSTVTISFY